MMFPPKKLPKGILIGLTGVSVLALGYGLVRLLTLPRLFAPTVTVAQPGKSISNMMPLGESQATDTNGAATETSQPQTQQVPPLTEMVTELSIPWEIAWLPDGSYLITERPGTLLRVLPDSQQRIQVQGVRAVGEGGLLGMVVHPNFAENNWIYLYLTEQTDDGLRNRVVRYEFNTQTNQLSQSTDILTNIPGAVYHDGGRMAFGPDGFLYITTGDAGEPSLAQDTSSLAGKILRITESGIVPTDNPFGNEVYSYGHRNPQGLAWDAQGRLWSSEHGPSGRQSGFDEVNLIEAGANYGWPEVQGDETRVGMTAPLAQSGATETWAPGDILVAGDSIFMPGLRGQALYEFTITESASGPRLSNLTAHFSTEYGRLRSLAEGPDGWYLLTSNQDGRGTPQPDDDLVIRINPVVFAE